jgi:hypothetical protein
MFVNNYSIEVLLAIPWPVIIAMLAVISPIPAVRPDFPPFTSDGGAVLSDLMVSGIATKIVT